MPVTFKSKAAGDVLMVSAHAQAVLTPLGKDASRPGTLIPEDMPAALQTLRGLSSEPAPDEAAARKDDDEGREPDAVPLRTRAWPLVQMIERALEAHEPIVWGV
jgi:hypothetical protein